MLIPDAPGQPGIEPRWTSSAKTGVGTALSVQSPVWFTLSHGILNEVFYPRPDRACIRDLGFIVTGSNGYFKEEKRDCRFQVETVAAGVPAFKLTNTALDGAWKIEKQVLTDPERPCVLQKLGFTALKGKSSDYKIYALLAPHLVNAGAQNTAWIGQHEGHDVLFAQGHGTSLALVCSVPWGAKSAGYVGVSDAWTQLVNQGELNPTYARADNGNVSLGGEIQFDAKNRTVVLALGFGTTPEEAAKTALASLAAGFDKAAKYYQAAWQAWQGGLLKLDRKISGPLNGYRISTAVLATHCSLNPAGAAIASLSIPWGASKSDNDLGGYHLVWPRDLVETAGGFLAAGDSKTALSILTFLREVQSADGSWPQNMWLDGEPYWGGIQLDECAFPLLLADMLFRGGHLTGDKLEAFMPMIRQAAGFVIRNGPITGQDRWEEDAGFSTFTLAVIVAALLAAADLFEAVDDQVSAKHLRETADCWNEQIEKWTYVENTSLGNQFGIKGYYVRIAAPDAEDIANAIDGTINVKNRDASHSTLAEWQVTGPDALALVRFGLRDANDPRMVNTVQLIDKTLRVELPQGPLWYRYNGDGYGEHEDGSPFDGRGIGRAWPLLAGERAHYELAAGHKTEAVRLLNTVEASTNESGLMPEQIWDGPDMPEHELVHGKPAGSAMPLVWTHSEHVKLLRSLSDGAVFDMPPQTVERYINNKTPSLIRIWRYSHPITRFPMGKNLRIEVLGSAVVHWSVDNWATVQDGNTIQTKFGTHVVDLPANQMAIGQSIQFTFYWHASGRWENADYKVDIV